MVPRELIDIADVPGGEPLRLFRRGADHMIVLDRNELMNSRLSGSEEALAVMTCQRISERPQPSLLIGGLGMGFTLRAALAELGRKVLAKEYALLLDARSVDAVLPRLVGKMYK